ncbi:glutaredoxin family protein [Bacillus andreraoultii]|uniref:glutaredoxin family protein n=1 Tax=Bacillus andreraoultii TaxID=1499685 RepID=UPI00053B7DBF|nr:glutaredoxin domain-containing protein [Bacillus andreraoultii]
MKIIKFSKPNCVPCQTVEALLKANGVKYEEYSIFKEPAVIEQYGLTGVPVTILVDDQEKELKRVVGNNPPALHQLIDIYKRENDVG